MNNKILDIPDITTHELISSYHDGLKRAVEFVKSKIIGTLTGQINLSQKEEAVMGIFLRIHALACSLVRLNQKIDFNAVASITRIIFELLIDLKLLSSQYTNQQDLDRFFAFPEVDRYRKAKRIIELQEKHPELVDYSLLNSSIRNEFVETSRLKNHIELKVNSLWGKTKKKKLNWPDHWSGASIRDRIKSFGPLYEQEYLEVYTLLSSYAHGGNSAYSNLPKEVLEYVYGISLEYARKMYIESLLICSKIFNLKEGIETFTQTVSFLKDAPKQILIKNVLKKMKE
ncbi:MAG TPA: DUF5677 domain-containing protein [Alphaproteobacteria bacterium]|nr:DUF5677 domain-containing protein [Alphaproteobacteria bacterium]HPR55455.1 DUF5677 domain-containing protein [Deltaproteobacteria bacterium]